MNVYFAASTENLKINKLRFEKIIKIFKELNYQVSASWVVEMITGKSSKLTSQELVLKNTQLLMESDLVVVELSTRSFGVGYQIGQALAHHKHVLCLYPDDMDINELSEIVKGSSSGLLQIVYYNLDNLEKQVRNYLASLKIAELRKFNFIASQEVIDFIDEGAHKENKSKSEFLRDLIAKTFLHK